MKTITGLLVIFLVTACASSPAIQEFLDPRTSVTVSYSDTPVILYIDRSGRAAFARGYVNIGPIRVNRMGHHRYFIWAGIWNTMETLAADRRTDGFELITLYADGEPIPLELAGWTLDAVGTSRGIYNKPVSSATDAYYEVTLDQIRLVAAASEISLRTTGDNSVSYQMWDSSDSAKRGFRQFLAELSD